MRLIDVTGQKFGKLTVIGKSNVKNSYGQLLWNCVCECGKFKDVYGGALRGGYVKSCGCENGRFKKGISYNKVHGFSKEEIFLKWLHMLQRCYSPHIADYKEYYYDKGIIVCDEWKNDYLVFKKWALENGWNAGLSLERKNSNKNYEPANCEWIPMRDQWITKTNTIKVNVDGIETAFRLYYLKGSYSISYKCAAQRVRRYGWSFEKALNTPLMNSGNRKKGIK